MNGVWIAKTAFSTVMNRTIGPICVALGETLAPGQG
jgi:hypothetical protein